METDGKIKQAKGIRNECIKAKTELRNMSSRSVVNDVQLLEIANKLVQPSFKRFKQDAKIYRLGTILVIIYTQK